MSCEQEKQRKWAGIILWKKCGEAVGNLLTMHFHFFSDGPVDRVGDRAFFQPARRGTSRIFADRACRVVDQKACCQNRRTQI